MFSTTYLSAWRRGPDFISVIQIEASSNRYRVIGVVLRQAKTLGMGLPCTSVILGFTQDN